ncbi:hypothetical protein ACOI1C_19045 [Bacillus sp. DJP31]|uniref:hypothetical protein n=1 Tax=Bacillus sp. DJP31 TaxID=3409789 RepID=UPI003BB53DF0
MLFLSIVLFFVGVSSSFSTEAVAASNSAKKEDKFDINSIDTEEEAQAVLKELEKYLVYDDENKVSFN